MPSDRRLLAAIVIYIIGLCGVVALGVALLMYHPQPKIIEKPVTVEKLIPCPPAKTGTASARSGAGGVSTAHSGSNDTIQVPQSSTPPKQKGPQQ